ncbi:MBL fold metallo-hydrolase [Paenibacillus sp. UNC451MF]|uniref:MBL fold metallo-hydrolase n=1 Tax=Paenibacillus sp. UNC451MF TaxID=1449063 RepID=UPI00055E3D96|nr:MBL fold metallo-hydrolase [Paenibacillus sp. UNC451MF]
MQVTVWGGAGEHGRSCYLVEHRQTRVLLDCGVKKEGTGEYPLLDEQAVSNLDEVFLSHAHEDHSMALPLLYKQGYGGKVWTTRATVRQLPSYFDAWRRYVRDQGFELPYEEEHIQAIRYAFVEEEAPPGEWLELSEKLSVCWGRSGHLPGSIWLLLNMEGSLAFFSGDYTSESALLAAETPSVPAYKEAIQSGLQECGSTASQEAIDLSIVEAAYGIDEDFQEHKLMQLKGVFDSALQQGDTVLLPVPTYGRGQELLLWALDSFPQARIVVEREIMDVFGQMLEWPEWLKENAAQRIKNCLSDERLLVVDQETERAEALAAKPSGGVIVFTNDGMMQSAKCRWYYSELRTTGSYRVMLTGHLARGSLGQRLLNGEEPGEDGSRIHFVRYKVHQGLPDVKAMLEAMRAKQTVLVHAGKASTDALYARLRSEGYEGLNSMMPGEVLVVQPG